MKHESSQRMSEDKETINIGGEDIPLTPLEGGAETERRKKIIGVIAQEYLDPEHPVDIDDLVKKYNIPKNSIYYYFSKEGVSRKGLDLTKPTVQKEISKKAQEVLSGEAEKIATLAFGLGSTIAKRYLSLLDYMMAKGMSLELIAEEIMEWYEAKTPTKLRIEELEVEAERLNRELSAAYAMNLPNFRYWLRSRILERYANQVLQARMMGVRLPVASTIKAMQTDLLRLEGDIEELFKGEEPVGVIA